MTKEKIFFFVAYQTQYPKLQYILCTIVKLSILQCLVEVGKYVLHCLEADGQADQILRDSSGLLFGLRQHDVRETAGMTREAVSSAKRGCPLDDLDPIEKLHGLRFAAFHVE